MNNKVDQFIVIAFYLPLKFLNTVYGDGSMYVYFPLFYEGYFSLVRLFKLFYFSQNSAFRSFTKC